MNFTIPIEIVVDAKRVAKEDAKMVAMGAAGPYVAKRENLARLRSLRTGDARSKSVPADVGREKKIRVTKRSE